MEEKANLIAMVILALVALVGAIYALITHSTKLRNWLSKRRKRREKLDDLIENADKIICGSELTKQMEALTDSVNNLTETTKENIKHNQRQDKEIERSLKQREVHDMALFALLDSAKQSGNNGSVTNAYQAMQAYMIEENSKPYSEILKKGVMK